MADNDFQLITESVPAGGPGPYFFGPTQIQVPFGDGFRCVGGAIRRLQPPVPADGSGVTRRILNLAAPPAAGNIAPGADLNFQLWYRDNAAGGSGFNLSDGVNVLWQ